MLTYVQALQVLLDLPLPSRLEEVPLLQGAGRYLAAPPLAPWPMPRFDNSAMDGYAVYAPDLEDANAERPVVLTIAGESAAGKSHTAPLIRGTAVRISTGARIPEGANAVVPIEETHAMALNSVAFPCPIAPESFVRRQGSNVGNGDPLLPVGSQLHPAALAHLASFNLPTVTVFQKPKVAILTSGDEIKPHGTALTDDQIVGSSLYFLEHELTACGCEPRSFGIAADNVDDFVERMQAALDWCDLLVTTAGVSVGNHDVVASAVKKLGGKVHFWKVAIRPGKPMLVVSYGDKHHLGFPGNPVSTCCNFEIFLKPMLRQYFSQSNIQSQPLTMRLETPCPRDFARLFFVYASYRFTGGEPLVEPLPNQNSGNLLNPARANCLIVSEAGDEPIPANSQVAVHLLKTGL